MHNERMYEDDAEHDILTGQFSVTLSNRMIAHSREFASSVATAAGRALEAQLEVTAPHLVAVREDRQVEDVVDETDFQYDDESYDEEDLSSYGDATVTSSGVGSMAIHLDMRGP